MNERIWELELQSYVTLTKAGLDGRHEKTTTIFDREKFAELIVGECVKKCEFVAAMAEITNTGEMARKTKATADSCAQMIEQHFGVEE